MQINQISYDFIMIREAEYKMLQYVARIFVEHLIFMINKLLLSLVNEQ